jgi:hypothetical protein
MICYSLLVLDEYVSTFKSRVVLSADPDFYCAPKREFVRRKGAISEVVHHNEK